MSGACCKTLFQALFPVFRNDRVVHSILLCQLFLILHVAGQVEGLQQDKGQR